MRFIRATIDGFSALHLPPTQESCEKSFRRRLEMPHPPPPPPPKLTKNQNQNKHNFQINN